MTFDFVFVFVFLWGMACDIGLTNRLCDRGGCSCHPPSTACLQAR